MIFKLRKNYVFISVLKAVHKAYYEKKEFIVTSKSYILQAYKRKLLSFILAAKVRADSNFFKL
jgi:hypothetical protein